MFATLLCLLTAAPLAQQRAGLIRNGSFEEGPGTPVFLNLRGGSTALTGWVVTGEGIDLVGAGYWRSSEGTYAIDLDGSARSRTTPPYVKGGIAQTFATLTGKRYRVTFDLVARAMSEALGLDPDRQLHLPDAGALHHQEPEYPRRRPSQSKIPQRLHRNST